MATLTAHGGGYGNGTATGGSGGSGGGAGAAGGTSIGGSASVGQGYPGGNTVPAGAGWSGGGGGGGGTYYATHTPGLGGSGIGGAGGLTSELSSGGAGAANTGSGGGGGIGGNGGNGIVVIRYVLDAGPYFVVGNSILTNNVTGSTRFTNTNVVKIATFPKYAGYDQFQCTGESGSIDALNSENWLSTNAVAAYEVLFAQPAFDTNVTLYVWFTNTTDTAKPLLRSTGTITYTTQTPVPVMRTTLTRERLSGANTIITFEDLDLGSSAGSVNGITMTLYARKVVAVNSEDDLTLDEPHVTF